MSVHNTTTTWYVHKPLTNNGGDGKIRTYSPEGTDLQSAAPLQLRRISINCGTRYGNRTHLTNVKG